MKFEEFVDKIANVTPYTEDVKFGYAFGSTHMAWMPLTAVSLGNNTNSVVKLPSMHTNSRGNWVKVVRIDENLFADRDYITDIILPIAIYEIPSNAFNGCTNLRRITIPVGVHDIFQGAFANCHRLEDVYCEGTEEEWKQINVVHEQVREKEPHKLGLICELENVPIPGNEALFTAKVHYNCHLKDI